MESLVVGELKRSCGYPFPFPRPAEILLSVTLSTAFLCSLSGEWLEKNDYLPRGSKGNRFLLSDVGFNFPSKNSSHFELLILSLPLLSQLLFQTLAPVLLMCGLSAATHIVFTT